jgi:putative hydrolase of the HAD superfamily
MAAADGGTRSHAMKVDVILFDLGGVLVELAGVDQMIAWSPGVATHDELWRRWLGSNAVRRFETGTIGRDDFAVAVIDEFGCPVGVEEFLAAFTWWPRSVYPGAFELLESLRPQYRLASVSNTNEIHWDRFSNAWKLDAAFHHNFPSYLVGKLKPDAEYFEHVLERSMCRPSACSSSTTTPSTSTQPRGSACTRDASPASTGARQAFVELGLLSKETS